jgi:hypothetical protein
MADPTKKPETKTLSPLAQLEHDHLQATLAVQGRIDALTKDLADTEAMARETRLKIAQVRREKLTASYAYDAKRAELLAAEKSKAA